jgi:XTP/dITP diphosphohydrolase
VLATTNPNKIKEIRPLLAGIPIELDLMTLEAWPGIAAPEETGATFDANARQKARYYAAVTGELVVAEDSGLEIDALGGAPGVHSARYGGATATYADRFARLYEALRSAPAALREDNHDARFVCALALARGDEILFETRGTVEGRIAPEPKGSGGFGYDPIFFYPPYGCTLGEATPEQKSAVSHRGQAFRALGEFLSGHFR